MIIKSSISKRSKPRTPTDRTATPPGSAPVAPRTIGASRTSDPLSLCEALDRILHKGVVVRGEVVLSVAGIDLVYLGTNVLLASVDTARDLLEPAQHRADAHVNTAGKNPGSAA